MWMTVWRPLILLAGLLGLGEAGAVTAVVSQLTQTATDVITGLGYFLLALQAVVSVGVLIAGVWGPVRRMITGNAEA